MKLRQGLAEAGLMSKRTMRKFDEMCLTPEDIRALRLRERASQAVFARHLNVTAGLVSHWERGEKLPRGASLKLLPETAAVLLPEGCRGDSSFKLWGNFV